MAPFRHSFLEIGCDVSFISGVTDVGYYSFYPFAHYALFLPLSEKNGCYIGAGGGWLIANYAFPEGDIPVNTAALDLTAGFNLWNFLNISYTLRTNFTGVNHKASVGYTYRF